MSWMLRCGIWLFLSLLRSVRVKVLNCCSVLRTVLRCGHWRKSSMIKPVCLRQEWLGFPVPVVGMARWRGFPSTTRRNILMPSVSRFFISKIPRACHAILNTIVYIRSVNFRFRSLLSRTGHGLVLLIRSLSRRCLVWSALLPCMTRAAKPSGGIIGGHSNCRGPAPVSCMSMPLREV